MSMYGQKIRKTIWKLRYRASQMLAPEGGRAPAASSSTAEIREEALRLWGEGKRDSALDLLRRTLRSSPDDSLTWMSYAYRLQDAGQYDRAYEAFINAVEIDPGNLAALEHFIDMARMRGETARITYVLERLGSALRNKRHRHQLALSFAIPYKVESALDVIASGGDPIAEAIVALQRSDGDQAVEAFSSLPEQDQKRALAIWALARGRRDTAINAIRELPHDLAPGSSLRVAIRRDLYRSQMKGAQRLLKEYMRLNPNDSWAKSKLQRGSILSDYQLSRKGFPFPRRRTTDVTPNKSKILYLLHNSLPYNSAGYATRTHGLLRALRMNGWDVEGVTRLGYPFDMSGHKGIAEIPPADLINDVPYRRLSTQASLEQKRPIQQYVSRYAKALKNVAIETRPLLIHAASNHWNGLTAVSVANELGIDSIYEVRGLWEVTRASRDPEWFGGGMYKYMHRMETDAAMGATRVIAITNALKSELVARGVDEEKITVVPNGVDTERFKPVGRADALAAKLGIGDRTVIGYVGSVVFYEGLDLLAEAVSQIATRRRDFVVMVVGDGAKLDEVKARVDELGVSDLFIFTGRVPHDEVEDYYSIIDIAPFPRLPLPVCEIVSPLKPFEAMAMGKAVVASDVAALAEIVEDGTTGLLHRKGDSESLASALERLIDSPELRDQLSANGRAWVTQEREWAALGQRVGDIYLSLGGLPADSLDISQFNG